MAKTFPSESQYCRWYTFDARHNKSARCSAMRKPPRADGHRVLSQDRLPFDESLTYQSLDPADPSVTKRMITIMLAEEY